MATTTVVICITATPQRTTLWFLCQVILSGMTLGPCVEQLAVGTPVLTDSTMMMQLCRHYWELKTLPQCAESLATPTVSYLVGQHTVKV